MIIYTSNAFAKRLKPNVSLPEKRVPQSACFEAWSVDILKITDVGYNVLAMNDATLFAIIIPLKTIKNFDEFLLLFIDRVNTLFAQWGRKIDTANQSALVLMRSDKSLISSMNDAKFIAKERAEYDFTLNGYVDWAAVEAELNEMPYSRIGYQSPNAMLSKLIR